MSDQTMPPAGWYPDPAGSGGERYWDGETWSKVTRPPREATPSSQAPRAGTRDAAPAPWVMRVLAFLGDWLILMFPVSWLQDALVPKHLLVTINNWALDVLGALQRGSTTLPDIPDEIYEAMYWTSGIGIVAWTVYRAVCVGLLGGTLAQYLLRLRVVNDGDRSRVGWPKAVLRGLLASVLLALPIISIIDVVTPLFNRKKQSIHDMVARTVVVRADQVNQP